MFFRLIFRLRAHFRPHSSAIFHPNTPHNFLLPVCQHMINDDLSKKKSPHFREKYLVLSYLKLSDQCVCKDHLKSEVWFCRKPPPPNEVCLFHWASANFCDGPSSIWSKHKMCAQPFVAFNMIDKHTFHAHAPNKLHIQWNINIFLPYCTAKEGAS